MIMCPFCQKPVYLLPEVAEKSFITLKDSETDDFYCNTVVEAGFALRSHYTRETVQGCCPTYMAIIPPFRIVWADGDRLVIVSQFSTGSAGTFWKELHRISNVSFDDFIQTCYRFQKLKAFS
jgi:hypothetical protein